MEFIDTRPPPPPVLFGTTDAICAYWDFLAKDSNYWSQALYLSPQALVRRELNGH